MLRRVARPPRGLLAPYRRTHPIASTPQFSSHSSVQALPVTPRRRGLGPHCHVSSSPCPISRALTSSPLPPSRLSSPLSTHALHTAATSPRFALAAAAPTPTSRHDLRSPRSRAAPAVTGSRELETTANSRSQREPEPQPSLLPPLTLLSDRTNSRADVQQPSPYPPLSPLSDTTSLRGYRQPSLLPSAAYIHLPFCRRRCHYCDFAIIPIGNRTGSSMNLDRMESYVALLVREMEATAKHLEDWGGSQKVHLSTAGAGGSGREFNGRSRNDKRGQTVQNSSAGGAAGPGGGGSPMLSSVYFGGGTPSLIPPHLLAKILSALDKAYGVDTGAEISMEIDPGTFDAAKLDGFLSAGVNRVSLGVQSFQGHLLEACGRAHRIDDVYTAVETVHKCGVRNWSLDLISSLPHQKLEDWDDSLTKALATGAPHMSVYDLQIEEGTPFGRWYTPGESPLPSDGHAADMYRLASAKLRGGGYEHYEISNYAKEGFQCRHNLSYWHARPYLAFGLSGASYLAGVRYTRPKGLEQYSLWVDGLEQGRSSPFVESGGLEGSEGGRGEEGQSGSGGLAGSGDEREGSREGEERRAGTTSEGRREGEKSGGGVLDELRESREGQEGPTKRDLVERAELLDKILDHVMLSLRLSAGLDLAEMATDFGADEASKVLAALKPHIEDGRAVWDVPQQYTSGKGCIGVGEGGPRGVVRLSDPEGFLVSNDIISSVFAELDGCGPSV